MNIEAGVTSPTVSGVSLRAAERTASNVETEVAAPTVHGVSLRTAEDQTVTQAEVAATSDTADTITYGGRVFINLSGPRDSWPRATFRRGSTCSTCTEIWF